MITLKKTKQNKTKLCNVTCVCRVRGWDVGINSSVNSQNSQMGVICFKLFWKGCLQKTKRTTTKPQKTKQK